MSQETCPRKKAKLSGGKENSDIKLLIFSFLQGYRINLLYIFILIFNTPPDKDKPLEASKLICIKMPPSSHFNAN